MDNTTICLIIFGSFFFMVAAFLPVSRVYMQTTLESKLALIEKSPITWYFTQIVFSLSSIAVASGFLLKATHMASGTDQMMTYVAAGLMMIGSIAWSFHLFKRAKHPGKFIRKELSRLPFNIYTITTIIGMILIGVTLLNGDVNQGMAWLTIILNSAFLLGYAIYKDLPPFGYYVITFMIGFMHLN